jgi:hypothetical protein
MCHHETVEQTKFHVANTQIVIYYFQGVEFKITDKAPLLTCIRQKTGSHITHGTGFQDVLRCSSDSLNRYKENTVKKVIKFPYTLLIVHRKQMSSIIHIKVMKVYMIKVE